MSLRIIPKLLFVCVVILVVRQVTLISEHDLRLVARGNSLNLSNGSHRRNLLMAGLKTKKLVGKTLRIGEAIFCYDKPRPPCGYLNKIEGRRYGSGVKLPQWGVFKRYQKWLYCEWRCYRNH